LSKLQRPRTEKREENVSVKLLEEVFLGIIFMVCFFMLTFCFRR